jgi:hypothetical protein
MAALEPSLAEMAKSDWELQEKAYGILLKVLQNIAQNPTEEKFRSIKSSSAAIMKVTCVPGGEAVLLAAGFTNDGEKFQFSGSDVSALTTAVAAIEEHANKAKMNELRRQRDEQIESIKAADGSNKMKGETRGDLMSEEMKLQLERDRKELEASRSVNPVKDSKSNSALNKFGMNGMKSAQDVIPQGGGG